MTLQGRRLVQPHLQSPFDLKSHDIYKKWLDNKLNDYPTRIESILVEVNDPRKLSRAEKTEILRRCEKTNMAIYQSHIATENQGEILLTVARQLGLSHPDHNWLAEENGTTALTVVNKKPWSDFIPYTNKAIHWHTDGYYNSRDKQIYSLLLHCVQPASSGGENALLDHEIVYLLMREANPAYISALMANDAMTIPARIDEQGVARPDETGPVFSIHPETGHLHMRYTARKHNISWKQDPLTLAAVRFLEELLNSDLPYIFRATLASGMGLVSCNVLHDRSAFTDDNRSKRLLYRARYYHRLETTAA